MKKNIQFNHEANSAMEAIGGDMTQEQFAKALADISGDFIRKEHDKISKLSEMLHDRLPYEVILFLATTEVHSTLQRLADENPFISIAQKLAKMMSRDEKQRHSGINMN